MLNNIIANLNQIIFPKSIYCICCGSVIDFSRSYSLCDSCIEKIKWVGGNTCEKCGRVLNERTHHRLCSDCRDFPHYYDSGYTCAEYSLYERAIVSDLKYNDKSYIGKVLGNILADRMQAEFTADELQAKYDFVIPVPISSKRYETRGYNQAEIMARAFSKLTGLCLDANILIRTASTEAMKDLSRSERYSNISGAFEVTEHGKEVLPGTTALIIDDIYTTGATAGECAKVLKSAGAERIDILTFAAGGDRGTVLPSSFDKKS